jgi:hypothetical protein
VANSLCREQEKRTMRESEVQIGNSGFNHVRECPPPTNSKRKSECA